MWEVRTHQLQLQNIDKDHTRSRLLHSASSLWVAGRAGKAQWRGWKDQSQSLWIAGHSERGWKESFVCDSHCENPSTADNGLTKAILDLDSATASALWVTGRAGKAQWRSWKDMQKEILVLDLSESFWFANSCPAPVRFGTAEVVVVRSEEVAIGGKFWMWGILTEDPSSAAGNVWRRISMQCLNEQARKLSRCDSYHWKDY